MLPRVSVALAQFIAPVTSSHERGSVQKRHQPAQPKEKEKKGGFKRQSKSEFPKAVPDLPVAAKAVPAASSEKAAAKTAPVAQTLILLLDLVQKHRAQFVRWLGGSAYRASAKAQKKTRSRKGAMLDVKVE